MVVQLLIMSAILGGSTFAVGMLPLSYAFSRSHLERLSALGTGLLLGAALGVIIPEGIESIIESNSKGTELPTGRIAFCLILGFVLMLTLEQYVSPDAHSFDNGPMPTAKVPTSTSEVEFDAELGDLDQNGRSVEHHSRSNGSTSLDSDAGSGKERAFALLLGLVFHACADGLALGVANLAKSAPGTTNPVSFIVFLALILHKAPTALAFTASLLSTNLPRLDCKKYLAIFSISTPLSAIVSYAAFALFGRGEEGRFIGTALLISGGTFLYVATVLQPVSHHSSSGELKPLARVIIIAFGMFIPLTLSSIIGHGH